MSTGPIALSPTATRTLLEFEKSQSHARAITEKLAREQESSAARIAAQIQAASIVLPDYQEQLRQISWLLQESLTGLSQAVIQF
jgi:hypothetical protein